MDQRLFKNDSPSAVNRKGNFITSEKFGHALHSQENEMEPSEGISRYFLMKSFNQENIDASQHYNVWATSERNAQMLEKAFKASACVILFFSVNMSGCFSGYAVMRSLPGESNVSANVFVTASSQPFSGRVFDIEWFRCKELRFHDCGDMKNPWNADRPIRIGRDGQEICPDVGERLCELFDENHSSYSYQTHRNHGYSAPRGDRSNGTGMNRKERFKRSKNQMYSTESKSTKHQATVSEESMPILESSSANHDSFTSKVAIHEDATKSLVLQIFPIDLTGMTYDDYIEIYQKSDAIWRERQETEV